MTEDRPPRPAPVPLPTARAALLLLPGVLLAALAGGDRAALLAVAALDLLALALVALDGLRTPGPAALRARRRVREPLSAFARNEVVLELASGDARPLRLALADGAPDAFDAAGHRPALALAPFAAAEVRYAVIPRRRGQAWFGDLHVRATGPLGLAARQWRVPLAQEVAVYPDLRALALGGRGGAPEAGVARHRGRREGRAFAALRPYLPGDDVRDIDWKATARRGAPVVREWQPERNQTVWLLLDCGRHLSARLPDGRVKLDHAVDAALALARAAAERGDRAGAVLFGAEVERVVPPGAGRASLGPLADALHLAAPRLEESDFGAAFDALLARQRRRALVVVFTDLADPDTSALLLARAGQLARRHLVLVAAVADPALGEAARAWPRDEEEALRRVAAERILSERELAVQTLAAAGVQVASVPGHALAATALARYLELKARGAL